MSENRFIVENDNDNNEVSIKDKVKDNYPFALAYEHIDDADNLIQECLSLVVLLNALYDENEQLQNQNKKLKWDLEKTREDLNYFATLKVTAMKGSEPNEEEE